jgi:cytochrome c553
VPGLRHEPALLRLGRGIEQSTAKAERDDAVEIAMQDQDRRPDLVDPRERAETADDHKCRRHVREVALSYVGNSGERSLEHQGGDFVFRGWPVRPVSVTRRKCRVGLLTSQEARAVGTELFSANCAICHGASGDGQGLRREGMNPQPANLTLLPWSDETSGSRIYKVIHDGVSGSAMPSWSTLSERQIWNLVAYIHSLRQ